MTQTFRGRAKSTIQLLEACKKIIQVVEPITVRGVCYRLFVEGRIDSMELKNTQKISRLLTRAREDGDIPWEWIVDESRVIEGEPHWRDLQDYAEDVARWFDATSGRISQRGFRSVDRRASAPVGSQERGQAVLEGLRQGGLPRGRRRGPAPGRARGH